MRSNLFLKLVRYVFLIPVGHFVFNFPRGNFLTLRHKVEKMHLELLLCVLLPHVSSTKESLALDSDATKFSPYSSQACEASSDCSLNYIHLIKLLCV